MSANRVLVAAGLVMAAAGASSGAIVSAVGGCTFLASPPVSSLSGALIGPQSFCWNEQTNVLASNLPVNILGSSGFYTGFTPFNAVLNGLVDSHMIHFDNATGVTQGGGLVTFSTNIRAVIYENVLLDISDAPHGNPGTVYDTGNPLRSHTLVLGNSQVILLGNQLRFTLDAAVPSMHTAQLRVFTEAVPAPGAVALAGVGLLAGSRRKRGGGR